jgi:hypothetical protein
MNSRFVSPFSPFFWFHPPSPRRKRFPPTAFSYRERRWEWVHPGVADYSASDVFDASVHRLRAAAPSTYYRVSVNAPLENGVEQLADVAV